MVDIPIPDGYKPKKRFDKQKSKVKKDKGSSVSPSLNKKELEKLFSGVKKKEPAQKFYEDIVWGDVKPPTKFDKFIFQKTNDTDILVKSQLAWLARESAYICRQIKRWKEEKVIGDIAGWYEKWYKDPFTSRLDPIVMLYKDMDKILARRLPALRKDFKADYKKMLTVANQCNRERIGYYDTLPVKPIRDFISAVVEFFEIVHTIYAEANVELDKLTKTASGGNAGDTKLKRWTVKLANEAIKPVIQQYGKTPNILTARFLEEKIGCPKSTLTKTPNWDALKMIKKRYRAEQGKMQRKPVNLSDKMLNVAEKTESGTVKLHTSHKKKNIEGDE